MRKNLDDTVALITGASSGIGAATARVLAAHGATVALIARRERELGQLAAEIAETGAAAVPIVVDVTDRMAITAAVDSLVADRGRLDVVVNNAGVMLLGPVENAPADEWDRMISVNLSGTLNVAHACLPHLLMAAQDPLRGVADLVNISSVAGRRAQRGGAVYQATKFAVVAFTESLRQEVTTRNVRVAVVEPGGTRTELSSHVRREVWDQMRASFGDIEVLEAQDIAEAISFIVTRPRRVAVNEMLIRPTDQQN